MAGVLHSHLPFSFTPGYDVLLASTVSCEIVDMLEAAAIHWCMPAENPADRLTEIAAILAAGLLRLSSRKSSPDLPARGDSPLDCEAAIRRHIAGEVEVSAP